MAVVRLEAFRALAAAIEGAVPELAGRVSPWDPNRAAARPRLSLVPVRMRYFPDQAEEVRTFPDERAGVAAEVFDPAPDRVIMNVGRHEALVQLRLEHDTPELRAELAEQISEVFLGTPHHPGVLITPVFTVPEKGPFVASWELEDEEWTDDLAFNVEYETLITVTGQIPALVTRRCAYTIHDLRLGLAQELGLTWGDPRIHVVRVGADGTLTPV